MTSSSTISDKALAGAGNLIKLLPTGTLFFYQFFSPSTTSSGDPHSTCSTVNKVLDGVLIVLCSLFCVFSCFTDSYTDPTTGAKHYGIVTVSGLWTSSPAGGNPPPDLSGYRLGATDFVHATLSLLVFATLALLDSNTVRCFYPGLVSGGDQQVLVRVLPAFVGAFTGVVFVLFPNKRHGIGYPSTINDNNTKTTNNNNDTTSTSQTPNNSNGQV